MAEITPAPALTKGDLGGLVVFLLVTFLAAGIGGFATSTSVAEWYPTLERPAWAPPDWLFGPVWTILYTLMAVAAWRVWRKVEFGAPDRPILRYGVQLGLNAMWSVLFFGLRSPGWALGGILLLLAAILWTTFAFYRHDRAAAWLMAPYLLWVAFATLLNAAIWMMNR